MSAEVIEKFHGVYLLYCMNPIYKGRTYIGYTVDPNRRIKQHNAGVKGGGAYRTNNKGPWKMVLIVHGFPNDISALRFEWAWTYPQKSRRLNTVARKRAKESKYEFCLRVLSVMLQKNPWMRLPLTIRWLDQEFQRDFKIGAEPPIHMPIAYGCVKPGKTKPSEKANSEIISIELCDICTKTVEEQDAMRCPAISCQMKSHIICLSGRSIGVCKENVVPIEVSCPSCSQNLLWGDLVRLKKGCFLSTEKEEPPHWCDILTQIP